MPSCPRARLGPSGPALRARMEDAHAQPPQVPLGWYRPCPGMPEPSTPDAGSAYASPTAWPWAPQRAPRTRGSRSARPQDPQKKGFACGLGQVCVTPRTWPGTTWRHLCDWSLAHWHGCQLSRWPCIPTSESRDSPLHTGTTCSTTLKKPIYLMDRTQNKSQN